MYYVYILRCADGTLYTGSARDVDRRAQAHNAGRGAKYTRSRLPVRPVYREAFPDKGSALRRESAIKKLTRAQKLDLIQKGGLHPMKLNCTLLAVTDIARSRDFYCALFGLTVTADYGANVVLSDTLCLQSMDTWRGLIEGAPVTLGHNAAELYFETEEFEGFVDRLGTLPYLNYVHPVKEHPWGQRAVRFYDPDDHIIEVGETLSAVARRFRDQGMDAAAIARRMDVSPEAVSAWLDDMSRY